MATKFSPDMLKILSMSREEAIRFDAPSINSIHIVLAMLRHRDNTAVRALQARKTNLAEMKRELEEGERHNDGEGCPESEIDFSLEASRAIQLGTLEARLRKSDCVDAIHVFMAILKASDSNACRTLTNLGITYGLMDRIIKGESNRSSSLSSITQGIIPLDAFDNDVQDADSITIMNSTDNQEIQREWAAPLNDNGQSDKKVGETPVLNNFGTDLTKAAEQNLLDPVVGRTSEIERVAQILCRRKKNNPILIGEPGCGKSAIVEGLAQMIAKHRISRTLWNKRIVMLDMTSLVAGAKYRGQFEERVRALVTEMKNNPDVIVFIDEIHTIVGAGNAEGSMDAANILKPALSRGVFQCIGATTIDEYKKSIEKDGALERRFQKVQVPAATPEETLEILNNLKDRYEEYHHVTYTPEALEACVKLTGRFVSNRCFPDKAIDVMDEVGSRLHVQGTPMPDDVTTLEQQIEELKQKKMHAAEQQNFELANDYRDQIQQLQNEVNRYMLLCNNESQEKRQEVSESLVADVVSKMTGIPVQRVGQEENERLRMLKDNLQKKVIGQNDAVAIVARAIQRSRMGLKDPKRPIGTFMFVGPTGVGKTYLTKCLAEETFGDADAIIRLDMSEYMEKHTVSRMVGAPPGYVGYEEGGQLTERVRRKPYSIVLLDEIEKAHPDVFNILLQVMDEGRLTDGNGNTIDFRNTIIIMTSNSGTKQISEFGKGIGFQLAQDAKQTEANNHALVMKALSKQFAPEFLNRLDEVVYFKQLNEDDLQRIVDIELAPLISRVYDLGHILQVTKAARQLLAKKGYDIKYGARPLRRAIQNMLENPLCEILLQENIAANAMFIADILQDKTADAQNVRKQEEQQLSITTN